VVSIRTIRPIGSRSDLTGKLTEDQVVAPLVPATCPEELGEDPWCKVVEMLLQGWAVLLEAEGAVRIVLYDDEEPLG
jgi:hypothetical protein